MKRASVYLTETGKRRAEKKMQIVIDKLIDLEEMPRMKNSIRYKISQCLELAREIENLVVS